ncbi:3040_t:CDS:2 [Diversispora eburnea]|uniref:3040_t:CDS:1 n=1 Tax=Diversispora eburnea TaxID=1213867 RepID=A0A9N8YNQ0_9GLOM|nr:3040_t:CDS:2 [Diversispora eburnea]
MLDTSLSQRCILAIGNTGNGKSFTATIFGAQNVKIGHTSKSETHTITIYPINGGFYIDTPGFDDSDEKKSDDDNKRSIFLNMLELNIQNITTVLWFVESDIRAKASYERQARFIESLAQYDTGNVWDNTILVIKGTSDANSQGPRDAAREIAQEVHHTNDDLTSNIGEFKIFLFERLLPESIYVKVRFSSDQINEYGVFKESEPERILARYESLMKGHHENPIRINLRKVKCSKCPEETDPRLALPECHSEMESFHPNTENIHQGNVIDIHSSSSDFYKHSDTYVEAKEKHVFDDSPQAWTVRVFTFGGINPTRPRLEFGYWKCCNNRNVNSRGCKQAYRCCEKDIQSPGCQKIYEGCRHKHHEAPCLEICRFCMKRSDTEGCQKRCKNCKKDPLNEKGCSKETNHNFIN